MLNRHRDHEATDSQVTAQLLRNWPGPSQRMLTNSIGTMSRLPNCPLTFTPRDAASPSKIEPRAHQSVASMLSRTGLIILPQCSVLIVFDPCHRRDKDGSVTSAEFHEEVNAVLVQAHTRLCQPLNKILTNAGDGRSPKHFLADRSGCGRTTCISFAGG